MKITHVVPQVAQEASGPSYVVPRLCQSLAARENAVELKCIAAGGPMPGIRLSTYPDWPVLKRFEVSTALAYSLRGAAREVDIVHNHSLWSMVNVAAGCVVPGHHAKLVTSPHGTLSAWALAHSKRRKQALWPLQRRALFRADLLHATCEAELAEIRALGIKVPVAIVPNGIDIPSDPPATQSRASKTLLFLSRIHPKKGIDELLHTWRALQDAHADWRLVIAGTGEPEHVGHVKQLAASLGVQRASFPGPLYGRDKDEAYYNADLFVLPTRSENFGLVVAEALAHGCPAMVSQGAPWQGLERQDCGWWVEGGVDALIHSLDIAMRLPAERLIEMGARGRAWMQSDFSWDAIGKDMDSAYRWILHGGEVPACIRLPSTNASDRGVP